MKKVSLADHITDISDSENAKKTRKSRAHHIPSSSEESENEKRPPKKRFKNIRSAAKKIIELNIQYPKFPSASSIIRSPLTNIENDNPVLRKHDRNISVVQEANTSVKTYNITDTSIDTNHTFLTSSGKNDFLIDNAELRKHDNNISVVQETNASVKTSNVTDIFTDINHTFFTTDEKMNYLIDAIYHHKFDVKEDYIFKKI
ncbi:uncharacterized protein LOC105206772 isoform X2 [Solenopsis invicta]|uniref:uncharacterized protein LOC105206772 isoform X2 n=1 Tax=Solenopsis invicta TaxID=13686 RepID=UPI00193D6B58|nr:uncharacterized protein LOC105206772 isoform X2 [Solenopsis invicta]